MDEKLFEVYSHLVESYSHQLKDEWKVKVKVEEMDQYSDHSSINSNTTICHKDFASRTLHSEVRFVLLLRSLIPGSFAS